MRERFATIEDIMRVGISCDIDGALRAINAYELPGEDAWAEAKRLCPAAGPLLLSEQGHACVMGGESHSVCFASTGRGKTRRHVLPMVLTEILSGSSFVVNDMKGEILDTARPLLDRMGYTTYVLDLRKPAESPSRYNPLDIAWREYHEGNKDAASTYLRSFGISLLGALNNDNADPFWASAATDYFLGLSLGLLEAGASREAFNLESIALADRDGNVMHGQVIVMRQFFDSIGGEGIARQLASGTFDAPKDTRMSIVSVFRQPMSLYLSQRGLMDTLSRSDFAPDSLVEEKRALFVVSPDETQALGPIVAGILNQVMSALISYAQAQHGGRLPRRIDFILDEFGNLPARIPDIDALVSAARSRNVRFHFVLQSEHQLTRVYGKDTKDVILNNVDSWYFMGSCSLDFMRHLSDLAGETILPSGRVVPLMSIPQMQHLENRPDATETLVLERDLRPYITAMRDLGTYEQVLPCARTQRPREQIERVTFDIKPLAKEGHRLNMQAILEGIG